MYRGSCQTLCEVSLLLTWKLFKNGPVIMFQIRFGEKTFSYFTAGSEHGKKSGCVFSTLKKEQEEWEQNSRRASLFPVLYCHLSCAALLSPHMPENYCSFRQFSTHFFPERGVKHQGVPMHTLHRPKNFERKDFWKSSAEKTWQHTM